MDKDIITAAAGGDRLETLIALRDLIAERLQNTGARDTASLSRRLMQCVSEIEELENKKKIEESDKSISYFRRKLREQYGEMARGSMKLNKLEAEHEYN